MTHPNPTLSVVLAVHNAEKTLANQVARLLDMLPDLTARFELLIVDDGSTDQTEEVAHELARDYPQLRVTRHPQRLGADAATRTAFEKTTGDVVIVHEGQASVATGALRHVWERDHETRPADAAWDSRRAGAIDATHDLRTAGLHHSPAGGNSARGRVQLFHRRADSLSGDAAQSGACLPKGERPFGAFPRLVARLIAQRDPIANESPIA